MRQKMETIFMAVIIVIALCCIGIAGFCRTFVKITPDYDINAGEVVSAVMNGESLWQKLPDTYMEYGKSDIYCWFQDLNMDGTPEFIVGPMIAGAHAEHEFETWYVKNGTLQAYSTTSNPYSNHAISLWLHDQPNISCSADTFRLQLFQNQNTGEFTYIYLNVDTGYGINRISFGSDTYTSKNLLYRFYPYDSEEMIWKNGNGIILSTEEALTTYDANFQNLTPYQTTIQTIPYTENDDGMAYITMTEAEKRQILIESYYAWSYEEAPDVDPPLAEEMDELRKEIDKEQKGASP